MREIKEHVRFYVQKRSTWADQSPTRIMMFNYDGKRLCTLTGLKIAEFDWDSAKQRVKLNVKRSGDVNAVLNLLEQKVNDIYFGAIGNGITPDNNYIIKELKKEKTERNKEKLSLMDEWQKYHTIIKVHPRTLQGLTVSFNHFEKFSRGVILNFEDVTAEIVSKYASYLQKLGYADNTVC